MQVTQGREGEVCWSALELLCQVQSERLGEQAQKWARGGEGEGKVPGEEAGG